MFVSCLLCIRVPWVWAAHAVLLKHGYIGTRKPQGRRPKSSQSAWAPRLVSMHSFLLRLYECMTLMHVNTNDACCPDHILDLANGDVLVGGGNSASVGSGLDVLGGLGLGADGAEGAATTARSVHQSLDAAFEQRKIGECRRRVCGHRGERV